MMPRLPDDTRRLVRIGNVRRDVDEELSYHFERTVEDLMSRGQSEQEAREEAARRFGDESDYRRELESIDRSAARSRRLADRIDAGRHMLTESVRSIVRSPGLTAGIVLAFALGIGANATMFGIIDRLLLRPPSHIVNPDRMTHLYYDMVWSNRPERVADGTVSYPDYLDLKKVKAFSDVSAESDRRLTIGSGESSKTVTADLVSDNFFRMLGTKPVLGRFFEPGTDRIGGPHETIISWGMWQSDFGGGRDVIGKTLDFGYGPYTIIGVAPKGFTSVGLNRIDMYLPMMAAAGQLLQPKWAPDPDGRGFQWLQTYARVADGYTFERAAAEATTIHRAARAKDVVTGDWGKDPKVLTGSLILAKGPNAPSATTVAKLLGGVSFLVLLIAAVNVANLLLARTIRQRRETAVRLALGISRSRLVGQLVLEGVLLALLGGTAALAVEHWGGGLVRKTLLPDVAWNDLGGDMRVIGAVAILAVLAGIIAAAIPAAQILRRDVADTIREAGAGGITRTTSQVRTTLSLAQTALSVILLVGAGLFIQSLRNIGDLDMGLDVDRLAYATIRTTTNALTPAEEDAVFARGIEILRRVPGVRYVATASTFPFRSSRRTGLRAEGVDSIRQPRSGGPYMHGVSADYFAAMGIDIVRGRAFNNNDGGKAPPVTVISEPMAKFLWPGQDPIGKCLYIGPRTEAHPCTRVVGVSEPAVVRELGDSMILQYYLPITQPKTSSSTQQTEPVAGHAEFWVVRTASDAQSVEALRTAVMSLSPRIRYADITPMRENIADQTQSWTLGATMFGIFGILALIVAAIGLYSVLAFDIAQRTRELGLRTALGATASHLVRMVVARAVLVTSAGLMLGGAAAYLLAPKVKDMLFHTSPRDPGTYAAVAGALLLVAITAAIVPGRRAISVDPNIALRGE